MSIDAISTATTTNVSAFLAGGKIVQRTETVDANGNVIDTSDEYVGDDEDSTAQLTPPTPPVDPATQVNDTQALGALTQAIASFDKAGQAPPPAAPPATDDTSSATDATSERNTRRLVEIATERLRAQQAGQVPQAGQ